MVSDETLEEVSKFLMDLLLWPVRRLMDASLSGKGLIFITKLVSISSLDALHHWLI